MATVNRSKPGVPNRHTINITELRTETREIVEKAHFRGWHYVVLRAGQPMVAVLNHEEYERLIAIAAASEDKVVAKDRSSARPG